VAILKVGHSKNAHSRYFVTILEFDLFGPIQISFGAKHELDCT